MEDSQTLMDSLGSVKTEVSKNIELGSEDSPFSPQNFLLECEREIQTLERDIRHQKESSVNAKTAITFEQLKKIHTIGRILGPQKEAFFDRICRAADIQRASLKNRLKQNKEKFEPNMCLDSPTIDSQSYLISPPTLQNMLILPSSSSEFLRSPMDVKPFISTPPRVEEDWKLPAERLYDLMQLGFSFEEIKQIRDIFNQFKDIVKVNNSTLSQVLSEFSNFISTTVPEPLKLIAHAFNLLEMGYERAEIQKIIGKERNRLEGERPAKIPRMSNMSEKDDSTTPEVEEREDFFNEEPNSENQS